MYSGSRWRRLLTWRRSARCRWPPRPSRRASTSAPCSRPRPRRSSGRRRRRRSARAAPRSASTMSGRSTRSALSTSIRRRPCGANSCRQALISELLPVPRAPVSSTLLAGRPATNCAVLARRRSFCASTSFRLSQRDRRDVAHRLEHARARAERARALAVAERDRGRPVRRPAAGAGSTLPGAPAGRRRASIRDDTIGFMAPRGPHCRRRRRRGRPPRRSIGCMPVKAPNAGSTPTRGADVKARQAQAVDAAADGDAGVEVAGEHVAALARLRPMAQRQLRRAGQDERLIDAVRRPSPAAGRRRGRRGCRAPARVRVRCAARATPRRRERGAVACLARMQQIAEKDDAACVVRRQQRIERVEVAAGGGLRHRHAEATEAHGLADVRVGRPAACAPPATHAALPQKKVQPDAADVDAKLRAIRRTAAGRARSARSGCA